MKQSSRDVGDLVHRGYRFALSLTHDPTRAEDLLQEAWFSVLKAEGPWNRNYLFTAIRHRFIDMYRKDRKFKAESLDEYDDRDVPAPDNEITGDDSPFVINGSFEQALAALRDEERAVLYLFAVEGYTAQQISDLFKWPRGTVLSMMHRARAKLKKLAIVPKETIER